jgi:hypothetical protein
MVACAFGLVMAVNLLVEQPAVALTWGMVTPPSATDELAGLRRFLKAFETNTTIRRRGVDVTREEIDILKREIAHLESILARVRN